MGATGIDRQLGLVACRYPSCMHEQRVIEQGVFGPDGEERGTQVSQIGVERRDIRYAPVRDGMSFVRSTSRVLPNKRWLGVMLRSNAP